MEVNRNKTKDFMLKNFGSEDLQMDLFFLSALVLVIFRLWEPIISSFEFFARFKIKFF